MLRQPPFMAVGATSPTQSLTESFSTSRLRAKLGALDIQGAAERKVLPRHFPVDDTTHAIHGSEPTR
jgi:hypothetical protein